MIDTVINVGGGHLVTVRYGINNVMIAAILKTKKNND